MGKKLQGAALRAKKRAQEAMEELQEIQAERVAQAAVVDEPDEALFVLDTEGGIVPHHERPSRKNDGKKQTLKILTAKEKLEVERLLETHSKEELVRMVKEGKALLDKSQVRTRGLRADKTKKANYDLWGNDDDSKARTETTTTVKLAVGSAPAGIAPVRALRTKPRQALPPPHAKEATIAVEVAQAGQSYRPDPTLHQKALEQAKLVEARRIKAQEYLNTPISQGMSEETKALLVGDTDSEDESSDDEADDDGNNNDETTVPKKRREKLTRAQRNKQKRLRVEKAIQDKQRKRRKLENSVAEIPRFRKEMRQQDKELEERNKRIAEAKEAAKRVKGSKVFEAVSESNPIDAPSYPIGLTTEVKKATLRTLKPKGSLVTDRIMSLRDRDLAVPVRGHKKLRKRKRRIAVKGKHNAGNEGADFAVLG